MPLLKPRKNEAHEAEHVHREGQHESRDHRQFDLRREPFDDGRHDELFFYDAAYLLELAVKKPDELGLKNKRRYATHKESHSRNEYQVTEFPDVLD
jgi:hypothetical protein